MNSRQKYKTKQRDMLIAYLKSVPGVHITAGDVCEYFHSQGAQIAQATVYRQLEKLVDEGIINKYIFDSSSPACFEYVDENSHQHCEICFHCKCEKCGKLIHLSCEELEAIQNHIFKEHKFRMDPKRTVFYGLCDECM